MSESIPRDVRQALNVASIALGAIGVSGIVVGYILAVKGETIPAFIGIVVGQIIMALTLVARWVLSYHAKDTTMEIDDRVAP